MRRLLIIGQGIPALALIWFSATAAEKVAVFLSGWAACLAIGALTLGWLCLAGPRRGSLWPTLFGAVVALGVVASVVGTAWPLRLSYRLSRPALHRLAEAVDKGQQPKIPVRAGFFVIQRAEVSRQGLACLWTDLRPEGFTGFVHCGTGDLPANLWSSIQVDADWHLVAED